MLGALVLFGAVICSTAAASTDRIAPALRRAIAGLPANATIPAWVVFTDKGVQAADAHTAVPPVSSAA
jgi:hypothetical protein